jgi:dihydroorotate dehydrogenase (NAD+) catalytic subunit
MRLDTSALGLTFPNPLILASGILGTEAALMERVARCGAGGITCKSIGPAPRAGHPNPTVLDWGPGLINAVGLANPGATAEISILREAKARLAPLGVPLIASIFADTVEGFAQVAEAISAAAPGVRPSLCARSRQRCTGHPNRAGGDTDPDLGQAVPQYA